MIEQIQARLGLDGTAFKKGLTSAKADWKRFTSDIGGDIRSMFGFGAAVAAAKMLGEEMLALKRRAEDLGASTDFVQSVERMAVKFGGTAEDAGTALTKLAEMIGKARTEGGDSAAKFEALGISLYKANGAAKSSEDIFKEIATAYKNTTDASLRAAMAFEFFGKTGRNINNILGEGADGIDQYTAAMKNFGLIASPENVNAVSDAWSNLKSNISGFGANAVGVFARATGGVFKFLGALSAVATGGVSLKEALRVFRDEPAAREDTSTKDAELAEKERADAAEMNMKVQDQLLKLAEKHKEHIFDLMTDEEKIVSLENELVSLYKEANDLANSELQRAEAATKLAEKTHDWKKLTKKVDEDAAKAREKERQEAAEMHMAKMDRLNELKDKQRQAQETVADRARFSLDELANANLRGVRDPGTREDIIKAREVRDLQAKAERERLSGAVGSRERALAFLSRADTIRQGITSLKSDERLTSIDRSLLEMKENEKLMLHYYEDAGVLMRPIMAK